jgi:hypothetical protein
MSKKAALCKGHAAAVADDDVVQHPHVHQRQSVAQPLRDEFIGMAGFGDPGRVLGCISGCNRPFCLWV